VTAEEESDRDEPAEERKESEKGIESETHK